MRIAAEDRMTHDRWMQRSRTRPALREASRGGGRRWSGAPAVSLQPLSRPCVFSSLTRQILFVNLAALGVLVGGILYLNQFRDGLIDAARREPADAGRDHRRRASPPRRPMDADSITHRSGEAARAAGRGKPSPR